MKEPELVLHLGPMMSGKTTELLRVVGRLSDALENVNSSKRVLLIHPKIQENRDVKCQYKGCTTHNSSFHPSPTPWLINKTVESLSSIKDEDLKDIVMIGIDESFYPDLKEMVLHWYYKFKISIHIASIDGDYKQDIFSPDLFQLIPYCTAVKKYSSICSYCLEFNKYKEAHQTIKINSNGSNFNNIEIGGYDLYRSVCYEHYLEHVDKIF